MEVLPPEQEAILRQALMAVPCAGGVESVEFLLLESVGGRDVEQAFLTGRVTSSEHDVIPHLYPVDCLPDLWGFRLPFSGSEEAVATFQAARPDPEHIAELTDVPVGSSVLVPLRITMKDGVDLGAVLEYDSLTILDAFGVEVSTSAVRPSIVGNFSDLENLADSVVLESC